MTDRHFGPDPAVQRIVVYVGFGLSAVEHDWEAYDCLGSIAAGQGTPGLVRSASRSGYSASEFPELDVKLT